MFKTAFVAACVLAVSGSVAFAQSKLAIGGATEAPFGAKQAPWTIAEGPSTSGTPALIGGARGERGARAGYRLWHVQ